MRTPVVAGNWKMNTSMEEASMLVSDLGRLQPRTSRVERLLIPPFPWIVPLHQQVVEAGFSLGAQNCAIKDKGALTGEVSAAMLAPYCAYVIAGHSERRHVLGESDEVIAGKIQAILRNSLRPILCVGELLSERENGQAQAVVHRQLRSALENVSGDQASNTVIAYEPVWAIGTGHAATADDAQEMAGFIRTKIAELYDRSVAAKVRIQYGGSVNAANAETLLNLPDVDGALVGGASLNSEEFSRIIDAAPRDAS